MIFVILGLVTVFKGVVMVPQGMQYPVERFGKYTRTLKPGLHIIVPYVDQVA